MAKLSIVIALIFIIIFTNCSNSRELFSVLRQDNDYVAVDNTFGLHKKVPIQVKKKIEELTTHYLKVNQLDSLGYCKEDLTGSIFETRYNDDISIYVLNIKMDAIVNKYYFIAYRKSNKDISPNPPSINGTFMNESGFQPEDQLLQPPLIRFEQIKDGSNPQIVIKQRTHNGNLYDAVVENCYTITPDLLFTKVMSIESIYIEPMEHKCVILRSLVSNTILVKAKCGDSVANIGEVHLDTDKLNIVSKTVYDTTFSNIIITGSGKSDIDFLRNGISNE
jgi:hypothetical protein